MKKRAKPMSEILIDAQVALEASDTQMCRHLRIAAAQFEAIRSGAMVLPYPSRKTLERRIERLYTLCGLEWEHGTT